MSDGLKKQGALPIFMDEGGGVAAHPNIMLAVFLGLYGAHGMSFHFLSSHPTVFSPQLFPYEEYCLEL